MSASPRRDRSAPIRLALLSRTLAAAALAIGGPLLPLHAAGVLLPGVAYAAQAETKPSSAQSASTKGTTTKGTTTQTPSSPGAPKTSSAAKAAAPKASQTTAAKATSTKATSTKATSTKATSAKATSAKASSATTTPAKATTTPAKATTTPAKATTAAAATAAVGAAAAGVPADWTRRESVLAFVQSMVGQHGFDEAELLALFGRTRSSPAAIRLMAPAPPGFRRSWTVYRDRFVEPVRIQAGLRFWGDHATAVARAAERWGVPEEILVSIIGVETLYGRHTGDFRVMDALTTLAFDYPRREAFFREELEQYLLLAREAGFDPLEWRGSFAGAVGLPQFMPGSVRRHAVDFDGDGRIDLRGSPPDAIGSVASFLANHGWRPGEPTHFAVAIEDEARARPAVEAGIPPSLTPAALAELGVTSPQPIPADTPLALVDLPIGDGSTHYVLGAHNFWVITRYNRSYFYAMAVIELARALRAERPGPRVDASR